MNLQPDVLRGVQVPKIDLTPLYMTSAGDDAIDLASVAGLVLDPWQEHVLRGALGERRVHGDMKWRAFEVGLICQRQNGKGSILEARELAGLFLFGEKMLVHTAHLFSTAMEHRLRMENLICNSELVEYVKGYAGDPDPKRLSGVKNGGTDISITLENGNRLKFLARSSGGGRGFTGDLVVLDEAYNLPDAVIAAMMPLMSARSIEGSPQIWYTSSAGMPDSDVLRRIRERGLNPSDDDNSLAYYEWSADDDDDPDDPATWAKANPALGIRISEEFVENERRTMGDEEFKRERLGIWAKIGGSSAIPPAAWKSSTDKESQPSTSVAFGVDITPLRDAATIAVASMRDDELVHVEVVDRRTGTDWVIPRLEELYRKWQPLDIVYDAASQMGEVASSVPRFKRRLTGLDARTYMQACGSFYDQIMTGQIRHIDQEELNEAVEASRRSKGNGDLWRWSRADTSKDISPLVAATLAYRGLVEGSRNKNNRRWVVYK